MSESIYQNTKTENVIKKSGIGDNWERNDILVEKEPLWFFSFLTNRVVERRNHIICGCRKQKKNLAFFLLFISYSLRSVLYSSRKNHRLV